MFRTLLLGAALGFSDPRDYRDTLLNPLIH